ncbi:hypothetical protein [Acetobacter malorum]|nr:hypothetical protein [Acetobacter malorum]
MSMMSERNASLISLIRRIHGPVAAAAGSRLRGIFQENITG